MVDQVRIGNVEVRAGADIASSPRIDPASFFPEVAAEAWAPHRARHLTPDGKIPINFGYFVLRSQGRTILVDAGFGPGPHANFGGEKGMLLDGLKAMGVTPDAVDVVAITHLHGDHFGWSVTVENSRPRATFPRARYLVPKGDWDYYTKPDVIKSQPAIQASILPLRDLGKMDLVGDGYAITLEVTTLSAPGHTPGHLCVLINSQGQRGIVVGDLVHSSVQFTETDWCPGADADKATSRRSRHTVLDRLEREGFVVAAGHLPMNANIGKVVRLQGRRQWQVL